MLRALGSNLALSLLAAATAACVGPQYDSGTEIGDVGTDDLGTESESESESEPAGRSDGVGSEPCPDLPPRAEDVTAARAAFAEGVSAFTGERWADAALAFCRAYAAHPAHQIMFNLGQCYVRLGDPDLAVAAFERFLAEGGDAVPAETRRQALAEIERLRARTGDGG